MPSTTIQRLGALAVMSLMTASLVVSAAAMPASAASPTVAWTRQFGTAQTDLGGRIAIDRVGRSVVVGNTGGAFPGQLYQGEVDAFIRRLQPGGAVLWTRQIGTALDDFAYDVDATPGGRSYVVGMTSGTLPGQSAQGGFDAFIRRYQPGGAVAWTRQFGTAGLDQATAVAVDGRGRSYVVGVTEGALPGQASKGAFDAFIRRYQPGGAVAWTRQFGTNASDGAFAVAVDRGGRVYVAGLTTGALAGSNKGGGDVFVRKYRPNGSIAWTRQFGSAAPEQATDMVVDRRGRVVLVGVTEGTLPGQTNKGDQDAFVRVYRPNGSVAWTRQFGSAQGDQVGAVAVDKGGSIYVAGSTSGALPGLGNKGGEDAFVRKLRPNGSVAWTRQFGSNQTDLAVGAAVDPSASLVVSGTSSGALPGQVSKGMTDAFVRKFR